MQKSHGSFNEWMDFSDLGDPLKPVNLWLATLPIFSLDGFLRLGCLRFRGQAKAMDVGKVIQDQAIHQPKSATQLIGWETWAHPRAPKDVSGHGETMVKPWWNPYETKNQLRGSTFTCQKIDVWIETYGLVDALP